jgi:hypothetical protein
MGSSASPAGGTVVSVAVGPEAVRGAEEAAVAATVGETVVVAAGAMGEPAWGLGLMATGGAVGGGVANAV